MTKISDVEAVLHSLMAALDEIEAQWNEQTLFAAGYIRPHIDIVYSQKPTNMDAFFTSINAEIQAHSAEELNSKDREAVITLWRRIENRCKTQFV